jgi:DNA polymerase III subunit gamma/tau
MSQAIYRKYRPNTFAEVVGQNHIKLTLQNEIELGNITHAYLFSGPRGIGKTTLARLFAKAVNCLEFDSKKQEPCNKCVACEQVNSNRSMDVIEVDAASQTGVDNVRENIIENVRFTPHSLKYKVFIIDEVHMLSLSAFNALLKTLEEPPAHAIFILCTTELYKLPETIISRCQRFDFKKISAKDMISKLKFMVRQEGIAVDDELIAAVARKGDGFMRDAESLLGQVLSLGKKEITMEDAALILPRSDYQQAAKLVGCIIDKNADPALDIINDLVNDGVDVERFNQDVIEYLRKLILAKVSTQDEVDFSEDMGEEIEAMVFKQVRQVNLNRLLEMVNNFIKRQGEFRYTQIAQLPLELAAVELIGEEDTRYKIQDTKKFQIPNLKEIQNTINKEQGDPNSIETTKKEIKKLRKEEVKGDANIDSMETRRQEITDAEKSTDIQDIENTSPQENGTSCGQENNQELKSLLSKLKTQIGDVKHKWDEVVETSKKYNHALQYILQICYPVKVEGGHLTLGFEYPFHKDRINEVKYKDILGQILREVFGEAIMVRLEVISGDELANLKAERGAEGVDEEKVLGDVLEAFGGKLVE